jgi:hypothetical protein
MMGYQRKNEEGNLREIISIYYSIVSEILVKNSVPAISLNIKFGTKEQKKRFTY